MAISTHLIAMPWQNHGMPSIQLGVLKSYVDRACGDFAACSNHSAHLAIPARIYAAAETFGLQHYGEYPYLLLCLKEFLTRGRMARGGEVWKQALSGINGKKKVNRPLTRRDLSLLARHTREFLVEEVVPSLSSESLNVIGFTLNFDQVYASLFAAKTILRHAPDKKILFLFGGSNAAYPRVAKVVGRFGLPALGVLGEGEAKLAAILRLAHENENLDARRISALCAGMIPGTYDLSPSDPKFPSDRRGLFSSQLKDLREVPVPDYEEYFEKLETAVLPVWMGTGMLTERTMSLPMEGTRGCFAKCDFCNLNTSWDGFRKIEAEDIIEKVGSLLDRYPARYVFFTDNVCDTWAEDYADFLLKNGTRIPAFMEMRAHHLEAYWTKLALSGVNNVQVGIESVAPGLLKAMSKGTQVYQNLVAQKHLCELGILSDSNLITHHPKSTLEDVRVTREIVEQIPHFRNFHLSPFVLSYESPLYRELSEEEKESLSSHQWIRLPKPWDKFLIPQFEFKMPRSRLDPQVMRAWDGFNRWYKRHVSKIDDDVTMTVRRDLNGRVIIEDKRFDREDTFELNEDESRIYDLCHRGPTLEFLFANSGLGKEKTLNILSAMIREKIVLAVEGHFIALAMRPREELIVNLLKGRSEVSRPELAVASAPSSCSTITV